MTKGAEPFFSKLFSKELFSKEFGKVWKKFLEKVFGKSLETGANSKGTCFLGHDTLFELCFRADVRRYDHLPYLTMITIKKASWRVGRPDQLLRLGLSFTAQCRPRAACAGGCKHNEAREWQAPVAENQPLTMLWQWRWTGNPVGIANPVTTMVKIRFQSESQ
jgi:hypothetical protein